MSSGKRRPGPPFISPEQADALTASLAALTAGIECLCQNVSGLRTDLAAHSAALAQDTEQSTLLRTKTAALVYQLDAFERYLLAVDPRYPRDRHGGHTPLAPANGRHQ